MKTLISSLLLAVTITAGAFANPEKPIKKAVIPANLGQQLSSYITYPTSLPKNPNGSIVMVQFKVGTNNRLRQLAVLTPDEKLNADLIRQLTGRKLAMTNTDPEQVHTVRIHFQTD